jgi:hypothetical protein
MARVFKGRDGYEFINLGRAGMSLVNEFQRHYPRICAPTQEPDFRFIRFGSHEENLQLEKLVADVLERDPEVPWKPKPFSKARAQKL